MKKITLLLIFIIFLSSFAYGVNPNVNVNGKIISDGAVIVNGRTLVKIRGVFEELGYSVDWDSSTSTATLKRSNTEVIIKADNNYFTVNGEIYTPDVPQQIINSHFYLPLRAIGEAVGANVSWNKESETAVITEGGSNLAVNEKTEAQPGLRTIKNLLKTGLMPVGSTMYIYGGGWNEEDTGAGIEAVTIGLSPKWKEFSQKQTSSYNYSAYNYKKDVSVIHLGLDCSGYVGWAIYNTLNTENNLEGYVTKSTKLAASLAERGWGTLTTKGNFVDYKPGDILSSSCSDCAHVWICVGQCDDGSVVLLHSSPQGVMLSGTYTPKGGSNSQAIALASNYMKEYYIDWYNKYPNISRNASYLSHYDRFRWDLSGVVSDPDGLTGMKVEEVLEEIFEG